MKFPSAEQRKLARYNLGVKWRNAQWAMKQATEAKRKALAAAIAPPGSMVRARKSGIGG